jgi:hypothetical protein
MARGDPAAFVRTLIRVLVIEIDEYPSRTQQAASQQKHCSDDNGHSNSSRFRSRTR